MPGHFMQAKVSIRPRKVSASLELVPVMSLVITSILFLLCGNLLFCSMSEGIEQWDSTQEIPLGTRKVIHHHYNSSLPSLMWLITPVE